MKKEHFNQVAIFIGWCLLFAFAFRSAVLGSIDKDVRSFQIAYLLGFAGYLILLWMIARYKHAYILGGWGWWVAGCILLRVVLVTMQPSDDVYRYVWEGRVQLAGFDPYTLPPDDPELMDLRNEEWAQINHPHFPAIYPPFAQMTFIVAAAIHPTAQTIKAMQVLWDVITILLLSAILKRLDMSPYRAFVYGLCPLVLTAYGIEGHVDSLMLMLTAASVWAVTSRRFDLAGVALGLAIASKIVLVVMLPWFVMKHRRAALIAILTTSLCYLVYGESSIDGLKNLARFAGVSSFFSFFGSCILPVFGATLSRGLMAVVLMGVIVVLMIRKRDITGYGLCATEALVILLPIIHFWYLSWVLLFLPFALRIRWIVCAGTMVFYFEAQHIRAMTGEWVMPDWVLPVVMIPFLLAWTVEWYVTHRRTVGNNMLFPA